MSRAEADEKIVAQEESGRGAGAPLQVTREPGSGWVATARDIGLSFGLLLAVWWVVASLASPLFLPSPTRVAEAFVRLTQDGSLATALWMTLIPLFAGLIASCLLGAFAGLIMGLVPPLDKITGPWVYVFWSTPIVAILPILILLFGVGTVSASVFVFLSSVFPVIMNARSGAQQTDKGMIEVARSLGARRREILWHVVLPSSVPPILSGFRIAVGRAVVSVIVAQLFISAEGIGYMIRFYSDTLQLDLYFAPLLLTVAIGVLLNGLADIGERRLVRWEAHDG